MFKSNKNKLEEARFSFAMPILKCYEEVIMTDKGEEKKRFLEGVASSTDLDLHGDIMAPSAIKSMADSIKDHVIGLNAEHDKSWQSDLGGVTSLVANKSNQLVMKAELDNNSKANDLWYALTIKKKELGLSIGGFVKDYTLEWDKKNERFKRVFKDIELDHIAVTSTPANPKTWVGAISKSIDALKRTVGMNISKISEMSLEDVTGLLSLSFQSLDKESIDELLTNYSLNKISMGKTVKSSLESDEEKDKATEEESKEAKKEDASEEETEEKESDSEEETQENEDKEEAETEEESKEEAESEEEAEDKTEEAKKEEAPEEKEESEKTITLTQKELDAAIQKGIAEGLKTVLSALTGKKDETIKTEEEQKADESKVEKPKDKEAKKSSEVKVELSGTEELVSLMKTVIKRQDSIEAELKKKSVRKTVKAVAIEKDEEKEGSKVDSEFKSMDEELADVRKRFVSDSAKSFVEAGKVRRKWAE